MFPQQQHAAHTGVPITSVATAMDALPHLKWQVQHREDGGVVAFVKLHGGREEHDFLILTALERARTMPHEHLGNPGDEGELIMSLAGELYDVTDDGKETILRPGDKLRHAAGSRHAPFAPVFWLGLYRQKIGNRIVAV